MSRPDSPSDRSVVARVRNRLEGPNTIGNSRTFWAGFAVVLLALLVFPVFGNAQQFSLFLVLALLGLSLSLVWGYSGVLSFGQVAFFGVGGYTFGVVSINFATPLGITGAVIVGTLAGAVAAALLGYFMFYGGVRDVYVTIITLVTVMVLHTFMAQTAGSEWSIGEAALGGFNGMPQIPVLTLGVGGASFQFLYNDILLAVPGIGILELDPFYYLVLTILVVTYLGLRAVVNSDFGRVMVAIREDEIRTQLFGYNVIRAKFIAFTLGGALAGLSGVLYAARNVFIDPTVFTLLFATLPVIWVSVGGRKSLLGAVVATVGVEYIRVSMAGELALVLLGALLTVTILVLPGGFIPWVHDTVIQEGPGPADIESTETPEASTEVTDS
jgi:branched-chain amino acid transport system permease protein